MYIFSFKNPIQIKTPSYWEGEKPEANRCKSSSFFDEFQKIHQSKHTTVEMSFVSAIITAIV